MTSRLGCGVYEVWFTSRGGGLNIFRARDLISLRWGRRINDFSEAEIQVALGTANNSQYGTINPWEHEISIYRDQEQVWCGPVVNAEINQSAGTAKFTARDLSVWFDHRWVEVQDNDVEFEDTDVSVVYDWLVSTAYAADPWGMDWYVGEMKVPVNKVYIAYDTGSERWGGSYPVVGDELRSLADLGIDYTVVRRTLVAGDLDGSTAIQARLTDTDWAVPPTMRIVGTSMATELGVGGGNAGYNGWYDDQIWIERPYDESRARYGLLQTFVSVPSLEEEDSTQFPNGLEREALNLRTLRREPYVYFSEGSLSEKSGISIQDLVPGRLFIISLSKSVRPVEDTYRLIGVEVALQGPTEQISVQMAPRGAQLLGGPL